jgi:hypothetical protein
MKPRWAGPPRTEFLRTVRAPTVGCYCDFDMLSCFIESWDILPLPIASWLIVASCFIESEDVAECFIVSCDIPVEVLCAKAGVDNAAARMAAVAMA